MARSSRPGDMFAVGALCTAVAIHYHVPGWLIFVVALLAAWGINEEERRRLERDQG